MSFLAPPSTSQFLQAPAGGLGHQRTKPRDDLDDFLSSDLELSFASTMSLNSPASPVTPGDESMAMDISPLPNKIKGPLFEMGNPKQAARPRAFTSGARLFGRDMSNNSASLGPNTAAVGKPSSINSNTSSNRKLARPGLPTEWISPSPADHLRAQSYDEGITPPTPSDCDMDVDTSFHFAPTDDSSGFAPLSAAPTIKCFQDLSSPTHATDSHFRDLSSPLQPPVKGTGFENLFYDTTSPRARRSMDSPEGRIPRKRRSASPESAHEEFLAGLEDHELSSPAPSSPSARKLQRMASNPHLSKFAQGLAAADLGSPVHLQTKRQRRPALSTMYPPGEGGTQSTYPNTLGVGRPGALPPPRRAFSAMMPTLFGKHLAEDESFSAGEEGSSFENSFGEGGEFSSPAQAYAQRAQIKTIRRRDGTEDFRPLTGATAMMQQESPSARGVMSPGLPGFGDNEAHGKILPCHRVKEDGLMRISPTTLNELIDGRYRERTIDFYVIDCRFDYEYNGGHVPGAININTTAGIEEFFLGKGKPLPSVSADPSKKTVIVFHCEFSVKRAPTFAKHLRSKDRAMNNASYPKVHYPEVYILEGGYCGYYKDMKTRCEPMGYVRMDDPSYALSRKEDLDQFRKGKFGRTKSYAYGELLGMKAAGQSKRNTAPARGLHTLQESNDGNTTEEETDLGDSPCPPPGKNAGAAAFMQAKKMARGPLLRAETLGPQRFAY